MLNSVIAAVSTPPGKGGVAIIRVSGEGSFEIVEKLFFPIGKRSIYSFPYRHQIYGDVIFNGEKIDDGMLTLFKSPASYTGEDTAELSIHGGVLVTRRVLEALFNLGAKAAEAGEFTKRAFVNGKLSLTDAEAIGMLLEAKSEEQIRLASVGRSNLNAKISEISQKMRELLSSMYARIDYPDEDLGDFSDDECISRLSDIKERINALLLTYRTGKAIREGVETVICGKPNVGKSSIYNMLFGEELAIVTELEGTTRDVLTGQIPLGRALLNISDTAGIRGDENAETVEKIGIERAKRKILDCELLICVFDASRPLGSEDFEIISLAEKSNAEKIALINKADLEGRIDTSFIEGKFENILTVSAKENPADALSALSALVDKLFTNEKISTSADAIVSTARQNSRLARAYELIEGALLAISSGAFQDATSADIELALSEILEIDGRAVSDEVVADIFSKFCVGK